MPCIDSALGHDSGR
jgi:hypothetical protein